jgi:hypothetical protein
MAGILARGWERPKNRPLTSDVFLEQLQEDYLPQWERVA